MRRSILSRLLAAGPIAARCFNTAELTGSLSDGLDALEPYYSQFLPQLFLAVLVPIMVLIAVAKSDPLSAVILLLTGPLIPVFMYLIGKQAEQSTSRQWKLLNQMSAYFLDVIQGLTTLKLLGRSKQQVHQIAQVSERFRQVTLEVLRLTFLSALALELLSTLSTAVVAVQVGLRLRGLGVTCRVHLLGLGLQRGAHGLVSNARALVGAVPLDLRLDVCHRRPSVPAGSGTEPGSTRSAGNGPLRLRRG